MQSMGSSAAHVAEQGELFARLTGIIKPMPWDMFFLVMGRTGSGKSTFISRCIGHDIGIGHGLESYTKSIGVFEYHWNGRRIFFIDTPGFNDTYRSDAETLETLASVLGASYANRVRIHGLVMLHPISDNRISGTSLRHIRMAKAISGLEMYGHVAIVTTMWPEHTWVKEDEGSLERRYLALCTEENLFGDMVRQGAAVFKSDEKDNGFGMGKAGARDIMLHLIRRSDMSLTKGLQLQKEIVEDRKAIGDTAAGQVVQEHITRIRQSQEQEAEVSNSSIPVDSTRLFPEDEPDDLGIESTWAARLTELEADQKVLIKSLETLHSEGEAQWTKAVDAIDESLRKELATKQLELFDAEESTLASDGEVNTPGPKHRQSADDWQPGASPHNSWQSEVAELRTEISQICAGQKRVHRYKPQIASGATNGVAAAITTSIITAVAAGGTVCSVM